MHSLLILSLLVHYVQYSTQGVLVWAMAWSVKWCSISNPRCGGSEYNSVGGSRRGLIWTFSFSSRIRCCSPRLRSTCKHFESVCTLLKFKELSVDVSRWPNKSSRVSAPALHSSSSLKPVCNWVSRQLKPVGADFWIHRLLNREVFSVRFERVSRATLSLLLPNAIFYCLRGRLLDSIQVEIPADNASLNLQMFDSNPDNQQAYTVLVQ